MTETASILKDAIRRSAQQDQSIRLGVACDIAEVMAEINTIIDEDEEADYVQENDGRYDIWGFDPTKDDGKMNWRLSVLCGDEAE